MKPTDLEFVVPDQPNRADREAILTPLKAFNDSQAEPEGFQELAILLRDPGSGETVGGLWAKLSYDWLFVDLMFVPQAARSIGVGSQLLKRAEEIAIARGCVASGLASVAELSGAAIAVHLGFLRHVGQIDDHKRDALLRPPRARDRGARASRWR